MTKLYNRHPAIQELGAWLKPNPRLPAQARAVADEFSDMATFLIACFEDSYELEASLRHLLEAKDAAVRCMIAQLESDDPRNDG